MMASSEKFPDVIELNVGGILSTTLLSTLTKDEGSTLAAMFSGRHVINKDKEGRFFIDCDGNDFQYILDFLRFGTLPPPENALNVYYLADYFNIKSLLNQLKSLHAVQYRQQVENIKNTFGMERYEGLKQEVINGIQKSNASPREDKVLHIYSIETKSLRRECSHNTTVSFKAGDAVISTNILVKTKTNDNINEGISRLLAYELCELGFGQYTDINAPNGTCACSCNKGTCTISCQPIVLYTH